MSAEDSSPTVGPWAREKLDALGAYFDFYTKREINTMRCMFWDPS